MLQSHGLMGKEGNVTMGSYKEKLCLNPILMPPVQEQFFVECLG